MTVHLLEFCAYSFASHAVTSSTVYFGSALFAYTHPSPHYTSFIPIMYFCLSIDIKVIKLTSFFVFVHFSPAIKIFITFISVHYLEFPMLQHKQTVSYHIMGFFIMMCHMLQAQ